MSGVGVPTSGRRPARAGFRLAIVYTRWNEELVQRLVDGALRAATEQGITDPLLVPVDGSLELPLAAQRVAGRVDAVVALGVVLEGETTHFEHVSRASIDGLLRVSLDTGVPVGDGVLTCHTLQQVVDRAGGEGAKEDKGYDATLAAIDLAGVEA